MCVTDQPAVYIQGTTADYLRTSICDILVDDLVDENKSEKLANIIVCSLLRDYRDVWEYLVETQRERDLDRERFLVEGRKLKQSLARNMDLQETIDEQKKEIKQLKLKESVNV
jgi:arginine/lysine/ornithine decarboxylase